MARHRWLLTAAALLVAACDRDPGLTNPVAGAGTPRNQILDGAHGPGNAHFFFLPPMVPAPSYSGTFDGSVAPVVQICEWSGSSCALPLVAEYSMTGGPGSETVRVDVSSELYIVNWHTGRFGLDVSKAYRIRVLAHDLELGHADVDIVASGTELPGVDGAASVGVINGRTLPIKFRIEEGAVTCAPLVTLDASNFVVQHHAGKFPSATGAAGLGFFKGTQVLFSAGFTYGTGADDLILGVDTRGGPLENLDLTAPVCLVQRGSDQETFATVRPLPGVSGPPNLRVTQRSFAFDAPPNDDYVLLQYTITNDGAAPVIDLFAGYVLDWDLAFSDGAIDDIARFNPALQLGEVVERNGALFPQVVGIVPIAADPLHYAGYVNGGPVEPLDHAGYFDLLSGGIQHILVGTADVRHVVGRGPATLGPGASRVYAFALVAGDNRPDFEANVEAARSMARALGFGRPTPSPLPVAAATQLTAIANNRAPTWSPDGSSIAFSSNRSGTFTIWRMNVVSGEASVMQVTPGPDDGAPDWFGSTIAFGRGPSVFAGEIYSVSDGGGAITLINGDGRNPRYSPDGTAIAFTRVTDNFHIWTVASGGGVEAQVTAGTFEFHPEWSPDGSDIYFTDFSAQRGAIFRAAAAGSPPERVTPEEGTDNRHPALSPDGRWLAFTSGIGCPGIVLRELSTGSQLVIPLEPLVCPGPVTGADVNQNLEFSPDGTQLLFAADGQIWVVDLSPLQ